MNAHTHLWIVMSAAVICSAASLCVAGINLDVNSGALYVIIFLTCSATGFIFRKNFETQLANIALNAIYAVGLFFAIVWTGAIASYAVAAQSVGWLDEWAIQWDSALHFNWLNLYKTYPKHSFIVFIGRAAYASIQVTPILLIVTLAIYRNFNVLDQFIRAFAISLGLTILVFAFFPMQSALVYLLHRHLDYQPLTSDMHVAVIEGLRSGTLTHIDPVAMIGLIGFPSFHTTCGVLFAWAGWQIRIYRFPMLAINVAMIAATPVEGAHYLSDIIGGILVAAVAIAASAKITQGAAKHSFQTSYVNATAIG